VGAVLVLGVTDVDGGGAGGYLYAVARIVAAVAGLVPSERDLYAVAVAAATVCAEVDLPGWRSVVRGCGGVLREAGPHQSRAILVSSALTPAGRSQP
jgi:hypothetical protein